jgi:hypothetical protein
MPYSRRMWRVEAASVWLSTLSLGLNLADRPVLILLSPPAPKNGKLEDAVGSGIL